MRTLFDAIKLAESEEIDGLWAILKYKDIGIMRKLKSMSALLDIDSNKVIDEAPQDEDNRIIDFKTRNKIHKILLESSKETYEREN
jgi:hypothetical protein|tara:strand:- start:615 stop:872 length:258 start_codon:yes stop_codon:yes gene_type:complete